MSYEDTFDVVIEGAGAERGAKVLAARDGLYVNQHEIPYETLLGVALRGSILLVVGTQSALALRGSRDGLATLAAELRRKADLEHLPTEDRKQLEGERVVFATPVAMSGQVSRQRIKGMPLTVVTDAALHVLDRGGQQFRLAWDTITRLDLTEAKFGRLLKVSSGATDLEFMYLTDAQIQTIRGLAARHSRGMLGLGENDRSEAARRGGGAGAPGEPAAGAAGTSGAVGVSEPPSTGVAPGEPGGAESPSAGTPTLEKPPAGPPATRAVGAEAAVPEAADLEDPVRHFTVPEFEMSLGGVGSGSDRPLGSTINKLQTSPVLPVGFLEEHLREVRTVYEGALVKAKREAGAADELFRAAQALDGRRLWEDVVDSAAVIVKATLRAFERQARQVAANRRIPWRTAHGKYMPDPKEIIGLKQRLLRGVASLEEALNRVSKAAAELRPAASAGRAQVRAAYERWLESLKELDSVYAEGWGSVSREIVGVWEKAFLPRLTEMAGERRRLLPWPARVAVYVLVAALVGALMYLYFTGKLGGLLPFA